MIQVLQYDQTLFAPHTRAQRGLCSNGNCSTLPLVAVLCSVSPEQKAQGRGGMRRAACADHARRFGYSFANPSYTADLERVLREIDAATSKPGWVARFLARYK